LREMSLDRARRAPDVIAVVTGRDLAGRIQLMPINPMQGDRIAAVPHPVLAGEKVRYVGEPVVGVVAESRAAAVDAVSLISVDYEPLPAYCDPRRALDGKVLLHEALGENVLVRMTRGSGDVDAAFNDA